MTKFQSNELTGAGPKLAADFNWRLGSFTLGGGGAGALIVANRDYSLRQSAAVNLPGFVPLVGYNSDETVLIPVLNAKSEVAWHFSDSGSIAIGYQYENWFNAFKNSTSNDDVFNTQLIIQEQDLVLHGPYIRGTYTWGAAPPDYYK